MFLINHCFREELDYQVDWWTANHLSMTQNERQTTAQLGAVFPKMKSKVVSCDQTSYQHLIDISTGPLNASQEQTSLLLLHFFWNPCASYLHALIASSWNYMSIKRKYCSFLRYVFQWSFENTQVTMLLAEWMETWSDICNGAMTVEWNLYILFSKTTCGSETRHFTNSK